MTCAFNRVLASGVISALSISRFLSEAALLIASIAGVLAAVASAFALSATSLSTETAFKAESAAVLIAGASCTFAVSCIFFFHLSYSSCSCFNRRVRASGVIFALLIKSRLLLNNWSNSPIAADFASSNSPVPTCTSSLIGFLMIFSVVTGLPVIDSIDVFSNVSINFFARHCSCEPVKLGSTLSIGGNVL